MENNLCFVSIIIPIFNNEEGLKKTLDALLKQTYIKERFEVFVIDNGSFDRPIQLIETHRLNNIVFLEENKYIGSPYSARNRGLEKAKGDVIVFLDATCVPNEEWLSSGIKALDSTDMIGGEVEFAVDSKSSLGEIYDSLYNIQMKESVLKRNVAKTCNLFVKRAVFEETGFFPEGLRSGGDVRWTQKANKLGFTIGFSPEAKVTMTPKSIRSLIKKQYRVAKGQPQIWKETDSVAMNLIKKVFLCWLPPNPIQLIKKLNESGNVFAKRRFFSLMFLGWYLRIVNGIGNVRGFI